MENAEQIYQLARAFQGSRILLTAFELGVFDALADGAKDSTSIAVQLQTDERATDRLLNALCVLGLVKKTENLFSNSVAAEKHLVADKEGFMAGLGHMNNLWDSWSELTGSIIRDNKSIKKSKEKKESQRSKSFIGAMHTRAKISAPPIVAQIDLTGVKKVLDVGGGSGIFSMQFVKSGKDLKATIFDLPHVVELSRQYVVATGLASSIDFLRGDYNKTDSFGSGYDLAFLCAVIHINSPAQNISLIQKCYKALNPGGRIVIQDFIMDDDRLNPGHGAMFAINMLVNTPSGDSYTETEITQWLTQAGFGHIRKLDPIGPSASIIGFKE